MEFQKITPGKFALNYGIVLGLIMVILSVVSYVTGAALEGAQWPQLVYYVLFPVVIIYAISQFKKKNANFLSLSEALKVGVLIGVVSAIVFALYNILFNYVIDPGFMAQAMKVGRDKMIEENPEMTQEMVDQSMGFVEIFVNPFVLSAFWLAMSALFALIYSLIGGLVMKKENTHA